jgi:hypothetical protein
MTRYLILFPGEAMDIPDEEMPDVSRDAHAVVQQAKDAGVYIFSGGLDEDVEPVVVGVDGTATDGSYPQTKGLSGGFAVLDLPSREAALGWAAKLAVACRCGQEVREFMDDPLA